jgi:hypothetical protein
MNGRQQRPFAYGTFRWPSKGASTIGSMMRGRPAESDVAIEILREFGATEFIGKTYIRPFGGAWTPAQWDRVDWHENFVKFPGNFVFDMAGSGLWEVLHFRTESDEAGPYIAVALRYTVTPHPWVAAQRATETR